MPAHSLPLNPELSRASRLRGLTSADEAATARDWAVLLTAGAAAALASTFLDFNLRVPGHAILRVVFPFALGLALVPRRGAGVVTGAAAVATALGLRAGGFGGDGLSLGALTSLAATGPVLDWALARVREGRHLYAVFAAAGLASNLLAFAVRGGAKLAGWEHVGSRPLSAWWPQAIVTYAVCGLLAGLLSAAVFFYGRRSPSGSAADTAGAAARGAEP